MAGLNCWLPNLVGWETNKLQTLSSNREVGSKLKNMMDEVQSRWWVERSYLIFSQFWSTKGFRKHAVRIFTWCASCLDKISVERKITANLVIGDPRFCILWLWWLQVSIPIPCTYRVLHHFGLYKPTSWSSDVHQFVCKIICDPDYHLIIKVTDNINCKQIKVRHRTILNKIFWATMQLITSIISGVTGLLGPCDGRKEVVGPTSPLYNYEKVHVCTKYAYRYV